MPQVEYLRLSMLLELSGDASRLTQSFLLLAATAARADRFEEPKGKKAKKGEAGDLRELENFSDDIRQMDEREVVQETSVTQARSGAGLGMIQKFMDSCGPTAMQVVRAEADPVEALRMRQRGELDQDALDTDAAREQEAALERHYNQVAVPRGSDDIIIDVTDALDEAKLSAEQRLAVTHYLSGQAFEAAHFQAALPILEKHINYAYPGADGLRMVREGLAGTGGLAGLTPDALVAEGNGALGVSQRTGKPLEDLFDLELWKLFTEAGQQVNAVNMTAWASRVTALLDQAETKINRGEDPTFIVYWHGGGGHFMTFTNVRTREGAREFLVHDPWTGVTEWVTQADALAGEWVGGQAIICGLQG